jgi:hypothetical protein
MRVVAFTTASMTKGNSGEHGTTLLFVHKKLNVDPSEGKKVTAVLMLTVYRNVDNPMGATARTVTGAD